MKSILKVSFLLTGALLSSPAIPAAPVLTEKFPVDVERPQREGIGAYLAARHAARIGDMSEANTYFSQAYSSDEAHAPTAQQAVLYAVTSGDVPAAIEIAKKHDLSDVDLLQVARLVLIVDELKDADYDAVLARLDGEADDAYTLIFTRLLAGWAHFGRGEQEKGLEVLAELRDSPLFRILRDYHTMLMYSAAGDYAAAREAFVPILEQDRNLTTRMELAYGALLERTGSKDEARQAYEAALENSPSNPVLEVALRGLDDDVPARLIVNDARQGVSEVLVGLAALYMNDDRDLSMVYAQLALYLDPDLHDTRVLIGDLYNSIGRYQEAVDYYATIDKASPYAKIANVRRADALDSLDRVDEAVDLLKSIEAARPHDVRPISMRASILQNRERYWEAAKAYDSLVEHIGEPQERHWRVLFARAICFERTDEWEKAEVDFLKALELSPDQPDVLNYLGYSWIEQGRHYDKAREMIETAVRKRPRDGYIRDSLGWVLYRLEQYKDAVRHMERAVELKPTDPTINDHLGDTLWAVGRKMEARFQWKRALSFDPPEEGMAERISRKLEVGLDVVLEEERKSKDVEMEAAQGKEVPVADDG